MGFVCVYLHQGQQCLYLTSDQVQYRLTRFKRPTVAGPGLVLGRETQKAKKSCSKVRDGERRKLMLQCPEDIS